MNKELITDRRAVLLEGIRDLRRNRSISIDKNESEGMVEDGTIMLCRSGSATIRVNYKEWHLPKGGVITLFPGDVTAVSGQSTDFSADMLIYSPAILREASLDIEHTVYEDLREDRCRSESPVVTEIVSSMFSLLAVYFRQSECKCLEKLVLYQLKAFFIGFHDYISRFPDMAPHDIGSKRKRSVFNMFMQMLEENYRRYRDVNWYAGQLHISSKYLNIITKSIAGHSTKAIIDHYVVLKIQQELTGTDKPLKQISWDYNFSDASFFTRYFRQHTGMTPRAWRLGEK